MCAMCHNSKLNLNALYVLLQTIARSGILAGFCGMHVVGIENCILFRMSQSWCVHVIVTCGCSPDCLPQVLILGHKNAHSKAVCMLEPFACFIYLFYYYFFLFQPCTFYKGLPPLCTVYIMNKCTCTLHHSYTCCMQINDSGRQGTSASG